MRGGLIRPSPRDIRWLSLRPGDFTTEGHFIVLVEKQDGGYVVQDPNSRVRSQKLWDYGTLEPQIKNLWEFQRISEQFP